MSRSSSTTGDPDPEPADELAGKMSDASSKYGVHDDDAAQEIRQAPPRRATPA